MLERLRRTRKALGLTQKQVAKALRRYQSFVSKCEQGERRIDVIELAEFAALYKTPIERLIPTVAEAENQPAPTRRIAERRRKAPAGKGKSGTRGSTAPQRRRRPKY